MIGNIAWWDLGASDQTVDSLQDYLRDEGVALWAGIRGLRLKFWISNRERNLWGAVMVWDAGVDPARLDQPLPPNRAVELIGYPPTERLTFEVEATVEGVHSTPDLGGLGAALAAVTS
jgi:hypothetical protein